MRPSFLSLRKEKKQKKLKPSAEGGEVWPGISRIAEGAESLKLLDSKYVPRPNLAGVSDALIFFCLLFFYQDKKRPSSEGGEVWPGTSRISGGSDSLKLLTYKYVPSQIWLSNETFFSFLEKRKEAKETQALYRGRGSLAGYIENIRRF